MTKLPSFPRAVLIFKPHDCYPMPTMCTSPIHLHSNLVAVFHQPDKLVRGGKTKNIYLLVFWISVDYTNNFFFFLFYKINFCESCPSPMVSPQ